jgi:hypothetical protein
MRELQMKLAGLSKSYLPGFPELNAIQQSIKQLGEEMAAEDRKIIDAYVAELEASVQAAKRNEQHIASLLHEQQNEVRQLNTVAAQYSLLESELLNLERFAGELYGQIRSLSVTEDAGALNVRLVEKAMEPENPVSPKKATTLFLALLVGSGFGTLLAFVRDWMDQRLRSAEEIKHVLGLPVLGVVPHIADARTPSHRGMFLHAEPMSDVAEAYRTVRTAVYFGQGWWSCQDDPRHVSDPRRRKDDACEQPRDRDGAGRQSHPAARCRLPKADPAQDFRVGQADWAVERARR